TPTTPISPLSLHDALPILRPLSMLPVEPLVSTATSTLVIAIAAATLAVLAFGRLPGVRISRAVSTLAGAVALTVFGALDLRHAWGSIDGEVIVLLFGLSVVNVALADAGAFRLPTAAVTRRTIGPDWKRTR